MKYAVIMIALALFVPAALAGSNQQTGIQSGAGWSESTFIDVQGGTGYTLTGLAADFDVFFYDASGDLVGLGINCGDDAGTVPATAVTGEITKWDDIGTIAPCAQPVLLGLPGQWTYTDGL